MGNIREYLETDERAIFSILTEPGGHFYSKDKVDFNGFNEIYVYEELNKILGFVCIEIHENISQIVCYVAPSHRCHGIGSQLFSFGKKRLELLDPNTTWLFFRNDIGDSARFYQNRGAQPWYSYHFMIYEKNNDYCKNIMFDKVINYENKYFEEYLDGRSKAFYNINILIDSRPYDEKERSVEIKKWVDKHEKDIWLFFKNDKFVGSIAIYEGFFDEVFVLPEWQHKGIGKEIVDWAINYCITQGWEPSLCVVTGNVPAINLYKNSGFKVAQTLELNRYFSINKEPDLRGPIGG